MQTAASCLADNANPAVIIGGTKLDYVKPAQLNDGPCWWDAPAASCSGSGVNPPPYQPAALRTTYASYNHPKYDKTNPGSPYDLALIVLNSQAPPQKDGSCGDQCIKLVDRRPADGAILTALGMGVTQPNLQTLATSLQELRVSTINSTYCAAARVPPPTGTLDRFFWDLKNRNPPINPAALCTKPTSIAAAGICDSDDGGPLIQKNATADSAANDRLAAIAAAVVEKCDNSDDPAITTDMSQVVDWLTDTMKRVTPVQNASAYLVASDPKLTPAATASAKAVFGYSMKIFFGIRDGQVARKEGVDVAPGGIISCKQKSDDTGFSIKFVGHELIALWSEEFLKKGFFNAQTGQPQKTTSGGRQRSNPFAVDLISCSPNQLKVEWSSSKGFDDTKASLDKELGTPAVAQWAGGARKWAQAIRCQFNILPDLKAKMVIKRFEITTGKGLRQRLVGNYTVDNTEAPPNCPLFGRRRS